MDFSSYFGGEDFGGDDFGGDDFGGRIYRKKPRSRRAYGGEDMFGGEDFGGMYFDDNYYGGARRRTSVKKRSKPKKKLSAWNRYVQMMMPALVCRYPNRSNADRFKMIAQMWKRGCKR